MVMKLWAEWNTWAVAVWEDKSDQLAVNSEVECLSLQNIVCPHWQLLKDCQFYFWEDYMTNNSRLAVC